MGGEWVEAPFADVIDFQEGPGILAKDFREQGVPLVRLAGLERGSSLLAGCNYLDPVAVAKKWAHFALQKGDILLSTSASLGRIAVVEEDGVGAIAYTGIIRMRPRNARLVAPFIRYLLEGPDFQQQAEMVGAGSVIRHFGPMHLRQMSVRLPPPAEQRAIACILGTLDHKIELNRRMNETMEVMARALFKSWFVDFDPVRGKMKGSNPGLPKPLADLFPARLVESELGEIPEGWYAGSFGSFISQRSKRVGALEAIVLSAVAGGKLARSDDHFTKRVYSKETDKYLLVEQWDFAYNPSRINIGSIGMLEEDIVGGVSPVYVVARPTRAYRWFLAFSIRRAQTRTWINMLASGSVRQSLSFSDFASIPCIVPSERIVQEFNRRWSVWREGIRSREVEIRILTALRDTLLPKLISGELRVNDPEKFIGRAV